MINRRTGYCKNCNSNVVHVRTFKRRFWYRWDQWTNSYFGKLGFGPWQCVDCKQSRMRLLPKDESVKSITDKEEKSSGPTRVGNFLRTDRALAHSLAQSNRFSKKFRLSVAKKLLSGKSTFSQIGNDLGLNQQTLEHWIEEHHAHQATQPGRSNTASLINSNPAGLESPEPVDWSAEDADGLIIDSKAIRKAR